MDIFNPQSFNPVLYKHLKTVNKSPNPLVLREIYKIVNTDLSLLSVQTSKIILKCCYFYMFSETELVTDILYLMLKRINNDPEKKNALFLVFDSYEGIEIKFQEFISKWVCIILDSILQKDEINNKLQNEEKKDRIIFKTKVKKVLILCGPHIEHFIEHITVPISLVKFYHILIVMKKENLVFNDLKRRSFVDLRINTPGGPKRPFNLDIRLDKIFQNSNIPNEKNLIFSLRYIHKKLGAFPYYAFQIADWAAIEDLISSLNFKEISTRSDASQEYDCEILNIILSLLPITLQKYSFPSNLNKTQDFIMKNKLYIHLKNIQKNMMIYVLEDNKEKNGRSLLSISDMIKIYILNSGINSIQTLINHGIQLNELIFLFKDQIDEKFIQIFVKFIKSQKDKKIYNHKLFKLDEDLNLYCEETGKEYADWLSKNTIPVSDDQNNKIDKNFPVAAELNISNVPSNFARLLHKLPFTECVSACSQMGLENIEINFKNIDSINVQNIFRECCTENPQIFSLKSLKFIFNDSFPKGVFFRYPQLIKTKEQAISILSDQIELSQKYELKEEPHFYNTIFDHYCKENKECKIHRFLLNVKFNLVKYFFIYPRCMPKKYKAKMILIVFNEIFRVKKGNKNYEDLFDNGDEKDMLLDDMRNLVIESFKNQNKIKDLVLRNSFILSFLKSDQILSFAQKIVIGDSYHFLNNNHRIGYGPTFHCSECSSDIFFTRDSQIVPFHSLFGTGENWNEALVRMIYKQVKRSQETPQEFEDTLYDIIWFDNFKNEQLDEKLSERTPENFDMHGHPLVSISGEKIQGEYTITPTIKSTKRLQMRRSQSFCCHQGFIWRVKKYFGVQIHEQDEDELLKILQINKDLEDIAIIRHESIQDTNNLTNEDILRNRFSNIELDQNIKSESVKSTKTLMLCSRNQVFPCEWLSNTRIPPVWEAVVCDKRLLRIDLQSNKRQKSSLQKTAREKSIIHSFNYQRLKSEIYNHYVTKHKKSVGCQDGCDFKPFYPEWWASIDKKNLKMKNTNESNCKFIGFFMNISTFIPVIRILLFKSLSSIRDGYFFKWLYLQVKHFQINEKIMSNRERAFSIVYFGVDPLADSNYYNTTSKRYVLVEQFIKKLILKQIRLNYSTDIEITHRSIPNGYQLAVKYILDEESSTMGVTVKVESSPVEDAQKKKTNSKYFYWSSIVQTRFKIVIISDLKNAPLLQTHKHKLTNFNGTLSNLISLYHTLCSDHFEKKRECMICYSVIQDDGSFSDQDIKIKNQNIFTTKCKKCGGWWHVKCAEKVGKKCAFCRQDRE